MSLTSAPMNPRHQEHSDRPGKGFDAVAPLRRQAESSVRCGAGSRAGMRLRYGLVVAGLAGLALLAAPGPAEAYIGPGAGFALVSSFAVVFITMVLAAVSILLWPFRTVIRMIRRRKVTKPLIRRLVVVGLDGQDPNITDQLLAEGRLPNFQRLADQGCYHRLRTSFPSVSPVAWSSFSTGTNPGRHNIFDFLDRDVRTYLPRLSSTHIGSVNRFLNIGKLRIPLGKPEIRLLRKSKPFWSVLGEHNIWSTVLRVPITFPPDRFYGAQLSAMCVPDLLGTQGTFFLYTTRPSDHAFKEGGLRFELQGSGDRLEAVLQGPENTFYRDQRPLELPLAIELDREAGTARVTIGDEQVDLERGRLSSWVHLSFKVIPGIKVTGVCRMMILEMEEHVSLYMTPINIDAERPAMPISHPAYFAPYLEKKIGTYATLGLAEDTWALNEKVTDDATFLQQTYDIDAEREAMFFAALGRLRQGALVTVFDATDRIQHMFWRYREENHPAARGVDAPEHGDAIEKLYEHNDVLIGKVIDKLGEKDLLMVLSDHGFTSFRRGINLNAWLLQEGYLVLQDDADPAAEWLRGVDWSRTKAYALGLVGIFINQSGREEHGIVAPGEETRQVKQEIIGKLSGLIDPDEGGVAIVEAFDTAQIYNGPYTGNAPDILIGYNHGYRISWDGASGVVGGPAFEDNTKAWSGDHCVDPRLVPGVFFCNRDITLDDPALIDIAPTALQLFGLPPARHMEGRLMFEPSGPPKARGLQERGSQKSGSKKSGTGSQAA